MPSIRKLFWKYWNRSAGKKKTELPFGKMFVLAILAGFEIGVPAAVTQMASYAQTNNSVIRMISGILFAFGLGMTRLAMMKYGVHAFSSGILEIFGSGTFVVLSHVLSHAF